MEILFVSIVVFLKMVFMETMRTTFPVGEINTQTRKLLKIAKDLSILVFQNLIKITELETEVIQFKNSLRRRWIWCCKRTCWSWNREFNA